MKFVILRCKFAVLLTTVTILLSVNSRVLAGVEEYGKVAQSFASQLDPLAGTWQDVSYCGATWEGLKDPDCFKRCSWEPLAEATENDNVFGVVYKGWNENGLVIGFRLQKDKIASVGVASDLRFLVYTDYSVQTSRLNTGDTRLVQSCMFSYEDAISNKRINEYLTLGAEVQSDAIIVWAFIKAPSGVAALKECGSVSLAYQARLRLKKTPGQELVLGMPEPDGNLKRAFKTTPYLYKTHRLIRDAANENLVWRIEEIRLGVLQVTVYQVGGRSLGDVSVVCGNVPLRLFTKELGLIMVNAVVGIYDIGERDEDIVVSLCRGRDTFTTVARTPGSVARRVYKEVLKERSRDLANLSDPQRRLLYECLDELAENLILNERTTSHQQLGIRVGFKFVDKWRFEKFIQKYLVSSTGRFRLRCYESATGALYPMLVCLPKREKPKQAIVVFHPYYAEFKRYEFIERMMLEASTEDTADGDGSLKIFTYGGGNNYYVCGAQDIAHAYDTIDEFGELPIVFRGHSLGGTMAIYFGARMPGRIAAIDARSSDPVLALDLRWNDTPKFRQLIENLRNVKLRISFGERDARIAKISRAAVTYLKNLGLDVEQNEQTGEDHSFWVENIDVSECGSRYKGVDFTDKFSNEDKFLRVEGWGKDGEQHGYLVKRLGTNEIEVTTFGIKRFCFTEASQSALAKVSGRVVVDGEIFANVAAGSRFGAIDESNGRHWRVLCEGEILGGDEVSLMRPTVIVYNKDGTGRFLAEKIARFIKGDQDFGQCYATPARLICADSGIPLEVCGPVVFDLRENVVVPGGNGAGKIVDLRELGVFRAEKIQDQVVLKVEKMMTYEYAK